MYYLLKNNIIIDTNNKTFKELYTGENGLIYYSIETPNETHCHYCLGGGEYEDNTYKFNSAQIKKQSENVFDLIEIGDLIIGNRFGRKEDFVYICKRKDKDKILYNDGNYEDYIRYKPKEWSLWKDEDIIRKIYKPNSKGDYIKVWEKKDE